MFAKIQPQAAYVAFIQGDMHRFSYFLRTIPNMSEYLKPLDDIINNKFLPAILGSTNITAVDRNLYSLPIKSGGMGIPIFQDKADQDHSTSIQITAPLAAIMVS